ncbi:MAG: sigma-70 family RNA polymerase sigma factor [Planctomycetes bacterium]|nr:sigma-70 family RNA polymerase sigma factor [Planctomycetota bacterium]
MSPTDPLLRCAERCAAAAWRLARGLLHDADEAYDAVQQAFLVVARKPHAVPLDDPWPWFAAVVANEARNLRRKRRPATNRVGVAADGAAMDRPDPRAADPAREAARADEVARLHAALDTLAPPEREAVVLTHLAGLSHAAAADIVRAPRQTVTDRARRGLDALAAACRGDALATARALALLPFAPPPDGLGPATTRWVAAARGAAGAASDGATTAATATTTSSGATGLAGPGGTIVATSKLGWVAGIALAAGLGFVGGGATDGLGLFGSDVAPGPASATPTAPREVGGAPATVAATTPAATGELVGVDAAASMRRLREENARLVARVEALERDAAAAGGKGAGPGARTGPTFTFGEMGRLDAVREADWGALAAAAKVVGDAVVEMQRHVDAGEAVPKEVMLRLQEHTERVRAYEYRTLDRMPTAARHNGELTHPISATNLLAGILAQAGRPLSAAQVAEFERLGMAFEEEFARVRATWGPDVPRARRLVDELRLKGACMDGLWAALTPEQRPLWVDPALRGLAGIDLFDPTLMVLHTSPVVAATRVEDLRGKLIALLRPKLGLAEGAASPALERAVDAFVGRTTLALVAVPKARVRAYSFADALAAGEATADLVGALLRDADLAPDVRKALLDDPTWYVPRLVEG